MASDHIANHNHLYNMKNILKLLVLITGGLSLQTSAQKLSNKQEKSVWLQSNQSVVNSDNFYQAYNRATGVFYTIGNDEKNYGRKFSIQKLRSLCFINRSGVNLLAISEAAEKNQ